MIIDTSKENCHFLRLKKRCEARNEMISVEEYLTTFNLLKYIINQKIDTPVLNHTK